MQAKAIVHASCNGFPWRGEAKGGDTQMCVKVDKEAVDHVEVEAGS